MPDPSLRRDADKPFAGLRGIIPHAAKPAVILNLNFLFDIS
jgi:hypothetical protein